MHEAPTGIALYDPYIKELRRQLFQIVVFFAVGAALGIFYYQQILSLLMSFFQLEGINLVLTSPYQFIDLSIKTGFFTGVILAFPISLFYLLKFIKPALKPEEYILLLHMVPFAIVLFVIGFVFGVWVVQYVIDLFSTTSSSFAVGNIWDLSDFLSQIVVTGISLALVFQLPIVLTILLRLKIITLRAVKKKRRVVYAALLVFAAVLPPTDMVALVLLTVIPLFLFETTLLLNSGRVNNS